MGYSVELLNIRKEYGSVVANEDITVRMTKGTVTCIVGENGAGKSTLMNILYGLEQPTSGEIHIDGKRVSFNSSRDAIRMKIGMVHQHFMLVDELNILENIILGMEPRKGLTLDYKKAERQLLALEEQFDMKVPLHALAGELPVGQQQKAEILKVLYRGAQILIMDEPTAVLTPQETKELFKNIRMLAQAGKTIVLITHHLNEVMEISDDIVVVRRGKVVANLKAENTNTAELAVHMVGSELPKMHGCLSMEKKERMLGCTNVNVWDGNHVHILKELSLDIHKGEILGVAGVSGNGQSELAQVIAGLMPVSDGTLLLEGEDITLHTRRQRMMEGISYIPEDRKMDGLCMSWSIEENSVAGYYIREEYSGKAGFLNKKKITRTAKAIIENFDVRAPGPKAPVDSLSGGNQQKVVIGRELSHSPKLIIAAEPTRGVDIGAISFIHNNLIDMRNSGISVLLISSDLDEILKLSDRIAVIYSGKIVTVVSPNEVTREELGLFMAGSGGA